MKQIITCAIAGLGNRGNDIYGNYQFVSPEEMKVTAVAEPQEEKREAARMRYGLPENRCFSSAEEMLAQPKLADVMVIATQDRQHVEQAVNAIKRDITYSAKNQSHRIRRNAGVFRRQRMNIRELSQLGMYSVIRHFIQRLRN